MNVLGGVAYKNKYIFISRLAIVTVHSFLAREVSSLFMSIEIRRRNIEKMVNFERGPPYINAHAQNNICIVTADFTCVWTLHFACDL